jgi:hypothetical protein
MVLLSLCAIKQYYHGIYHRMAVNYHGKKFFNIGPWWQTKYHGPLQRHFNPYNYHRNLPRHCFITMAPSLSVFLTQV